MRWGYNTAGRGASGLGFQLAYEWGGCNEHRLCVLQQRHTECSRARCVWVECLSLLTRYVESASDTTCCELWRHASITRAAPEQHVSRLVRNEASRLRRPPSHVRKICERYTVSPKPSCGKEMLAHTHDTTFASVSRTFASPCSYWLVL